MTSHTSNPPPGVWAHCADAVIVTMFLVAFVAIGGLLAQFVVWAWRRWFGDKRLAREFVRAIDDPSAESAGYTWVKPCMRRAAHEARAKFGLMSDTPATREVVGRFIREFMSRSIDEGGMGMRPTHVMQWSPGALELYFIPCQGDQLAYRVRHDPYLRSHKEYRAW